MDAQRILINTRRTARPARLVVALTVEALTRPVDVGSRRNAWDALADGRAERPDRTTG
ncbi:hypothetical protein [Sporichthya sp.]|uniref:hypothetical protein n=1 Tax=Sporichthya sp. TaxID=65475 RepID=UPI00185B7702|nr:hypothetical protein [Sporichthya sp.]MBA3742713.1 hypothetical protein [Sporichthya sp.]